MLVLQSTANVGNKLVSSLYYNFDLLFCRFKEVISKIEFMINPKKISRDHAEAYYRLNSMFQATFMQDLFSQINIKPGFKCLDIGCGTGNTTAAVAKKVGDFGLVIGCDPDKSRIEIAQKNHPYKNISFLEGTLAEIALDDCKFDLVFSNSVYHWISPEEQIKTTEKTFCLLKPGSFFILTISRRYPPNLALMIPFLSRNTQQRIDRSHKYQPEAYYKDLFTKVGFEIISFSNMSAKIAVPSIELYLEWIGATLCATKDIKRAYVVNEEKIQFSRLPDGTLNHESFLFAVILRKP